MTSNNPDGSLLSLAAAAERGDACPYIYVLVGGWLIAGQPATTAAFLEATGQDLTAQLAHAKAQTFRGPQQQIDVMVQERVAPMIAAFGQGESAGPVLNLLENSVTTPAGGLLQVPSLRIQLSSVGAWWAARPIGSVTPPRGGTAFVGGMVSF